jgi:hypothetical protein
MMGTCDSAQRFVLPGGYADTDCELLRDVELTPLSGRDEELIAAQPRTAHGALLTALLSRCVRRLGPLRPVPEAIVRRLLVVDRQFLLLKLRQLTCGDYVQATVQCPWEPCRQKVDIDFALHEIPVRESDEKGPLYTRELSPDAAFIDERGEPCREVVFRLPNGEDQEAIAHLVDEDEAAAFVRLLARCIRRLGTLPEPGPELVRRLSPVALAEIERHMEMAAPHIDSLLAAHCPECDRDFTVPLDLLGSFVAECQAGRDLLYRDVHYLAYHYHWSEQEILTLSRDKRRRYVAILADELRKVRHAI